MISMGEKKYFFRDFQEAADNAERLRDENGCDALDIKPTPDGRAVVILKTKDQEGDNE